MVTAKVAAALCAQHAIVITQRMESVKCHRKARDCNRILDKIVLTKRMLIHYYIQNYIHWKETNEDRRMLLFNSAAEIHVTTQKLFFIRKW